MKPFMPKDQKHPTVDLIGGEYLAPFQTRNPRRYSSVRGNSLDDEPQVRRRRSPLEINLGLYKSLAQPWVKMFTNETSADFLRRMHPARVQYEMFSNSNPMWHALNPLIDSAKKARSPVDENNIFWQAQKAFSDFMVASLDGFQNMRDQLQEAWFHAFYGSPIVQALVGLMVHSKIPGPSRVMAQPTGSLSSSELRN